MLHKRDIDLLPCPLTFYSKGNYGGNDLPILSRIAFVIFPCSPASEDVERTNSSAKKVFFGRLCEWMSLGNDFDFEEDIDEAA